VVIWDTRNFEKPVVSLETGRPVAGLAWCPTRWRIGSKSDFHSNKSDFDRPGLLANSGRDSPSLLLHDIMSWAVGQEDGEPAVSNRSVLPARSVPPPSAPGENTKPFCGHSHAMAHKDSLPMDGPHY
jgi:hypothetical protein